MRSLQPWSWWESMETCASNTCHLLCRSAGCKTQKNLRKWISVGAPDSVELHSTCIWWIAYTFKLDCFGILWLVAQFSIIQMTIHSFKCLKALHLIYFITKVTLVQFFPVSWFISLEFGHNLQRRSINYVIKLHDFWSESSLQPMPMTSGQLH